MDRLARSLSAKEIDSLIIDLKKTAKAAEGKTLFARVEKQGDKETIQLFTRSAINDLWVKLKKGDERRQQKLDANTAISAALQSKYPPEVAKTLMSLLGLGEASGKGIKLEQVRANIANFERINAGYLASSLQTSYLDTKIQFNKWHIAANDGLRYFAKPSDDDSQKLLNLKSFITPQSLMAFQEFVGHSIKFAFEKSPDTHINKPEVLNFIAEWCGLNDAEKNAFSGNLSPQGQSAMKEVDFLVQKIIAVRALPLSASNGFGLHRNLARAQGFDGVTGVVRQALIQPAQTGDGKGAASSMKRAAQHLGGMIAESWKTQGGSVNYVGKQPEIMSVLRSFADRHLSPEKLGIPPNQKDVADVRWRAYREVLVTEACNAALRKFYEGTVTVSADSIIVGARSYKKASNAILGEGAEGVVKKLTDVSGHSIAVKSIRPNSEEEFAARDRAALLHEAGIHTIASKTRDKNLLHMLGSTSDAEGNVSLCMEYAPHRSIEDYKNIFNKKARESSDPTRMAELRQVDYFVFKSVMQGLKALHGVNIVHRDLKPANLFIGAGGTPKIGDFGKAATVTESISKNKPVDTPFWVAPELAVIAKLDFNEYLEASPAADVWSAAVIMYQLITGGDFPLDFSSSFLSEGFENLQKFASNPFMTDFDTRFAFLKLDRLADKGLANQLCDMMHPDPAMRPSAAQVLDWLGKQELADDAAMGKLLVKLTTPE